MRAIMKGWNLSDFVNKIMILVIVGFLDESAWGHNLLDTGRPHWHTRSHDHSTVVINLCPNVLISAIPYPWLRSTTQMVSDWEWKQNKLWSKGWSSLPEHALWVRGEWRSRSFFEKEIESNGFFHPNFFFLLLRINALFATLKRNWFNRNWKRAGVKVLSKSEQGLFVEKISGEWPRTALNFKIRNKNLLPPPLFPKYTWFSDFFFMA